MSRDRLVEQLLADLAPVRPRNPRLEALLVAGLVAIELALFVLLGFSRRDMPRAMGHMTFWWKLASLAVIAAIAATTAILSFDPARSPRKGLRLLALAVVLSILLGLLLDAATGDEAALLARIDWRHGLGCVWKMALLSLPPLIGLGVLMRRGAPADPEASAIAVGVTAAAIGAFVFVAACPSDDPLYVAIWYLAGCGLVTALARLVLPRLTRW